MCGIVGYVGKRGALPVLIDGLKRLEYRGYDSAGVACMNGNGLEVYKTRGKIKDLESLLPRPLPDARIGLGHTRWATHGIPSSRNAHPHTVGAIAVVHNGIIENYHELRDMLCAEGHAFTSETDTEVIPHLLYRHVRQGRSLPDALREAVAVLKGSFALGIMSDSHPGTLFAVRRGSPLVIGMGDNEHFFASDIPALLPYTNRFVLMEDGTVVTLTATDMILDRLAPGETASVPRQVIEVDWTPAMAEKEGFDHFMLKEIHEQPRTVHDTFSGWPADAEGIFDRLGLSPDMVRGLRRLQIAACGTSYHAALVGRCLIERLARLPVDVEVASEYRYRDPLVERGTLFISITQSGETADTLAAQREAQRRGAGALTICNVLGSTAAREAGGVLYTKAGPEIGVASTKAFTSQMAALSLLSLELGAVRGTLTRKEYASFRTELMTVPAAIREVLQHTAGIRTLAETLTAARSFLYLGRGISYPIALEGALKMKEISYIPAEGYPAGEMKHGPIALIEEGSPVVVIAPRDALFEKILSNIEEVKARGGRVIAVSDHPEALRGKADELLPVPSLHPALTPFITVIPLQLLAYYTAVVRGCEVDQPRNLAKSVTVE